MNEILEYIKTLENGATEDLLSINFPNLRKQELVLILNNLLHQNQIEIYKTGHVIHYKAVVNKTVEYENMIISLIAASGANGLWLRDIKNKTNISHNLVLKILKTLEDTRRIKSIKSVKNNRKTYVLYDTKPNEDISGGVWFSNNDVDSIFVTKLMDVIYKFVNKHEEPFILNKIENLVKMKDLRDFIINSGISQVPLSSEDINTLIDCLCYDGLLEKIEFEGVTYLRALKGDYMMF